MLYCCKTIYKISLCFFSFLFLHNIVVKFCQIQKKVAGMVMIGQVNQATAVQVWMVRMQTRDRKQTKEFINQEKGVYKCRNRGNAI